MVSITIAAARFGPAQRDFAVTIRVRAAGRRLLHRSHGHLSLRVLIASPGSLPRSVATTLAQAR
jgi:hypothetical protein